MSRRHLRLAVLTTAALCAIGAALVVAFATTGSSSNARPISKFAAADPDNAAAKFGNGNELSRGGAITPADWEATKDAYPATELSPQWAQTARGTFTRIAARTFSSSKPASPNAPPDPNLIGVLQNYGPQQHAIEPGVLNFTGRAYNAASRTASIAIDPACGNNSCRVWVGPVGGGVWMTQNALAGTPSWTYVSSPFAQNTVGEIAISPFNSDVIYVGTGEPNFCSSGCEAGVGIYRSLDGGASWSKLSDTCVNNATYSCVTAGVDAFLGRGISEIVVDPSNPNHLLVGSATAARSISHIIGLGGQVRTGDPGANLPGLYESLDGGSTFTPVWIPDPDPATFPGRRGVIDVGLDLNNTNVVYASALHRGVWRRCPNAVPACGGEASAGATDFKQVWAPRLGGEFERTMFDVTIAPNNGGATRIYLTTGAQGASPGSGESPASFWRTDNANLTAAALQATEGAVGVEVPPAGNGNPFGTAAAIYNGWQLLTSASTASPYWATHNFCTGQCWYDQDVYSPKNPMLPDQVYVLGSFEYGEGPCDTRGVGCGTGISNYRGVLWSTTAGDPDSSAANRTFTDMTMDATNDDTADYCAYAGLIECRWAFHSIHPDQHEIVVFPNSPNRFIEASDGGLVRSNGVFQTNGSALCNLRGLGGSSFAQCSRLLSRMPQVLENLNTGLSNTLQFVGVAVNPSKPCQVIAGTQDNSTWSNPGCDHNDWTKFIYGDGGNAGFDKFPDVGPSNTGQPWVFNEFTAPFTDANFRGGDPTKWVVTYTPLLAEAVGFYWPTIADPNPPVFSGQQTHPVFSALRHVWRSWAFGAGAMSTPQDTSPDVGFYEANCPEFLVGGTPGCGDYQPLGGPAGLNNVGDLAGTAYGGDRTGGAIGWIARRGADTQTAWAVTSGGRVFVTRNVNDPDPAAVVWYRVDTLPGDTASPTRHANAVYPHPTDPNVAYVSYSGYNAATPTTPGHVFRVSVNALVPTSATFTDLGVEAGTSGFPTPTGTGDLPINDVVADDATLNGGGHPILYAASDFGVLKGTPNLVGAYAWTIVPGLPRVEVSHLAMVPGQRDACRACGTTRLVYAATHSLGIWLMRTG